MVTIDLGATRGADLSQGESTLKLRVLIEQTFDRAETLEQSLRVVDAVHTDSENLGFDTEGLAQRGALVGLAREQFAAGRGGFRKRDADRIRSNAGRVPESSDSEPIPLGERLDGPIHARQKIVAVPLRVEADQVSAEEAIHEFARKGADPEHLGIGPRHVPEDRHARIRPGLLHDARQQCKVVVLHQENGRGHAGHFFENGVSKHTVHFLILVPVFGSEHRTGVGNVTKRPEPLVGEAVVVAALLLGRHPHATQGVSRAIWRDAQPVVFVDDDTVGIGRAVRNPRPVAREEHGLERRHESACRHQDLRHIASERVHVRLAVRDDKDWTRPELLGQAHA